MIIHSFTSKAKRDAAAADLATRWKKLVSIDLAEGEDLRIKEFAEDLTVTSRDPIAFTNRFLVVAGERKPVQP